MQTYTYGIDSFVVRVLVSVFSTSDHVNTLRLVYDDIECGTTTSCNENLKIIF